MPELPEVEILIRHLRPLLRGRRVLKVEVRRDKVLRPTVPDDLRRALKGALFQEVSRRGKYLLFQLEPKQRGSTLTLLGHLGMTGRMYLLPSETEPPKHTAVAFDLGEERFVFEDTRYFGRLTLDLEAVAHLGPEPLSDEFQARHLAQSLCQSRQPIKVKLLDQSVVAGVGNIYASEALFRAGISPRLPANRLRAAHIEALWRALREVLAEAIECGSTVPLNFSGQGARDRLFYYGRAPGAEDYYEERLRVYDRAGAPCWSCGGDIKRVIQAARSTYYCPKCQPGRNLPRKNPASVAGT
jgi:formamidopyrimidine-DNA glycosylase